MLKKNIDSLLCIWKCSQTIFFNSPRGWISWWIHWTKLYIIKFIYAKNWGFFLLQPKSINKNSICNTNRSRRVIEIFHFPFGCCAKNQFYIFKWNAFESGVIMWQNERKEKYALLQSLCIPFAAISGGKADPFVWLKIYVSQASIRINRHCALENGE